jgi:hypothetical protein
MNRDKYPYSFENLLHALVAICCEGNDCWHSHYKDDCILHSNSQTNCFFSYFSLLKYNFQSTQFWHKLFCEFLHHVLEHLTLIVMITFKGLSPYFSVFFTFLL